MTSAVVLWLTHGRQASATANAGQDARLQAMGREIGEIKKRPDDELCFFTPNGNQDEVSPNRADPLVWAVTDLMLAPQSVPRIRRV